MASLYLGIRLPQKPFERLRIANIDLVTKNVADLKIDAEKLINFPHNELEFIYCGNILENDNQTLGGYGIRSGTTIQVFQKQYEIEYKSEPATTEQIQKAVNCYRSIFKEMASLSTIKMIRPELMKQILEAYPEFHTNLGAYAILRDSVLVQPMTELEAAKSIAKEYPIMIHSAEFVTSTLREHLAANRPNLVQIAAQTTEDSLSDSSSSEGDSPANSPNQRRGDIRQISRDQLSQALMLAGTTSTNSLSNIAQRNQAQSNSSPSTSGASTSGSSAARTTPASISSLISNSMFSNALSQALSQATGPSNQSTSSQSTPSQSASNQEENLIERYATELQTMREMGLSQEHINVRALVLSNGDVEAAVNLVLSGLTFN